MLNKLLIANRGEIACRIIQTAKEMGLQTVAVYSEVDAQAKHVQMADEAVCIGLAPAKHSYLQIDKLMQACLQTNADALHPGYGFLSENPDLSEACAKNNITFIGPRADAIASMANKDEAKKIMQAAGIPVTPGHAPASIDELEQAAKKLGTPLLIKAQSGGGGKGMRVVHDLAEFQALAAAASREAQSNFNDASIFIEKYIANARHVEVQICRDQHGRCVHFYDRDCSVQRRHQKIIEEAPAPNLPDALRQKMFAAACAAADAVDYQGVGTVEFLVTPDGAFYFMEMNTRLQVEHPITEMITDVDLVAWQLRVAAGEHLLAQDEIHYNGKHAIEVRLCAEDPREDFKPQTGRLSALFFPRQSYLRIEAGYRIGDRVSVYYDSLLAKLICTADDREQCIEQLCSAMRETFIVGVSTNRHYVLQLLQQTAFRRANLSTQFIDKCSLSVPTNADQQQLLTAAVFVIAKQQDQNLFAFRLNQNQCFGVSLFTDKHDSICLNVALSDDTWQCQTPTQQWQCRPLCLSQHKSVYQIKFDNTVVDVYCDADVVVCQSLGCSMTWWRQLPVASNQTADAGNGLLSKMPSTVVDVMVKPGDKVLSGAQLMILEAMKIETTITAPQDGAIKQVYFKAGDVIAEGELLLEFE